MSVGAHHETGATVTEVSSALFFSRSLAMEVDHDSLNILPQPMCIEFTIYRSEWVLDGLHEHSSERVDDQGASSSFRFDRHGTVPGRRRKIVDGPD
jgi:hypothetical protein